MPATMSAVIVALPEVERVVGAIRAGVDPAAGWGVPAHVTLLVPFVPPDRIDDEVLLALTGAVGSVPRFTAVFSRIEWFGDKVVWLAPEPVDRFRVLTSAVCDRFPGYPPYGGAHPDVVPHLTIGDGDDVRALREAARVVAPLLPLRAEIAAAQVICGSRDPGSWATVAELPLGS
ncbi:MAG TPA: 2'-5' RNA ligase family protein [Actinomycetes bacterium]